MTTRRCERRRAPRRQRTSIAIDVPSLTHEWIGFSNRSIGFSNRSIAKRFQISKRKDHQTRARRTGVCSATPSSQPRPTDRPAAKDGAGACPAPPPVRSTISSSTISSSPLPPSPRSPRRVSPRRYLRRRLRAAAPSLFRGVSLSLFRVTSRPVRRVIPPLYQRSPIDTVSTAALVALIAPLTVPRLRGSSGLLVEDVPVLRTVRARLCQHLRIGQKRVNLRRVFGVGEIGSILGDLRRRRRTSLVATVRLPGTDSVRVGRRRLAGRRNRSAGRRRDRRR